MGGIETEQAEYSPVEEKPRVPECQSTSGEDGPIDLTAFMPLVRSIACRIHASIPPYAAVDLNDLMQSGHLGLVHAGRAYQSSRQVPFAVYARFRIRGEILDSLRQGDIASRTMRRMEKKKRATKVSLTADLQREPTNSELNEKLMSESPKTGSRQFELAVLQLPAIAFSSLDELDAGTERWRAPDPGPDCLRSSAEARQLLDNAINRLPQRSRELVDLYYRRGLTMRQIGEKFHVNESRISQIHRGALKHLERYLKAAGINSSREV